MSAFETHMEHEGFSTNTIKAFLSDLGILTEFVGIGTAVDRISTQKLNQFVTWLLDGRGVSCSSKSLARRVTTLKVFFGWLTESDVLARDPSAPVIHRPVSTPLPDVLGDEEVARIAAVTEEMRQAESPDARPRLLVDLLLATGIKKGECTRIVLNHIDRSEPGAPVLWIRYANPQRRHKERKLDLPPEWLDVLDEYVEQYQIQERLFPCTARNLEYVLEHIAEEAGIERGVSFEMLRWTSALRDYQSDMAESRQRQKLGITTITWRGVKQKLAELAGSNH